jgi:hypothetical protein
VRGAWESPYAAVRLLERSRDYAMADPEGPTATIPRASFAALSVAFSRSLVCLSEAGGPVRSLDLSSGRERWRHVPPKGTHFLRVAFSEDSAAFVGVSWPFERGGAILLQRFASDGKATVLAEIGPTAEMEFAARGGRIVTASGAIYAVSTGKQTRSLAFPFARPPGGAPSPPDYESLFVSTVTWRAAPPPARRSRVGSAGTPADHFPTFCATDVERGLGADLPSTRPKRGGILSRNAHRPARLRPFAE